MGNELAKKKRLFLLISVISVFILIGGYIYLGFEEDVIRTSKHNEIRTIAKLKTSQFISWHKERLSDVSIFSSSPFFVNAINEWSANKSNETLKRSILTDLETIQKHYSYQDIYICSKEGIPLITIKDKNPVFDKITQQKILEAVNGRKIILTDFYKCSIHNSIHYDIIAPIIYNSNKVEYILLFRVDPDNFLYPLINSWPTESKTAETLLLRKEGDSVLFLNNLRHIKNSALNLKISLKQTNVPAVKAVLGYQGIFEGKDYRGVEVLSYVMPIQNTNWFMVSKVDQSEIYSELRYRSIVIGIFVVTLISIISIGLILFYRTNQKNIYKELFVKEKELREYHEEFKTILYSIGDGVITTDLHGNVRQLNQAASELTGWEELEAKGFPIEEVFKIINEDSRQKVENPIKRVLKEGSVVGLANHTLLISKDGNEIPISDSGAPIRDENGEIEGTVLVFRDKSEEHSAEKKLREREFWLRESQRVGRIGSYELNIQTDLWTSSEVLNEIFGIDNDFKKDVASWNSLLHPMHKEEMLHYFLNHVIINKQLFDKEYQIIRKNDGEVRWVWGRGELKFDSNGNPTFMIGTIQDITERKRIELALEKRMIALTSPLDSTSDISFDILFNLDEIQKIQDAFALANGVASIITDVNGRPITKPSNFCNLCNDIIRKTEKGLANCYHSDKIIGGLNPHGPTIQRCLSGGLWDGGASIRVGDNHIANWLIGQVLDDSVDEELMLTYADEIGADKNEFKNALKQVSRMPKAQFEQVCKTLYLIAEQLSNLALQNVQQARYISERKQIEEALRSSEEKFRSIVESSPTAMYFYFLDEDNRLILKGANPAADKIVGISHNNLIGKTIEEAFPNLVATQIPQMYRKVALKELPNQTFEIEYKDERFSGYYNVHVFSTGLKTITVDFVDVTDIKTAEIALKESEERYFSLIQNQGEGLGIVDLNDNFVFVNPAAEKMFGTSIGELVGKNLLDFIKPKDIQKLSEENRKRSSLEKSTYEIEIVTSLGEEKNLLITATPQINSDGVHTGTFGVFRDITDRKKAEATQKVLYNISSAVTTTKNIEELISIIREQLGTLLDTTNFYVAFYDEETQMLSSPYMKDEMDQLDVWPAEKSLTGYVIKNKKTLFVKKKDIIELNRIGEIDLIGTTASVWLGVPLFEDGKVMGAFVVQSYDNENEFDQSSVELMEFVSDQISLSIARKKTEKLLEEKQHLLSKAQRIAKIGSWNAVIESSKILWSDEMYRIFNVDPQIFNPSINSIQELIYSEDKELFLSSMQKQFTGQNENGIEVRIVLKDSTIRYVNITGAPVFGEKGIVIGAIGVAQDITERKLTEIELEKHRFHLEDLVETRTEELDAINRELNLEIERKKETELLLKNSLEKEQELSKLKSRFISTASHEFRTPLSSVLSSAELIKRYGKRWSEDKLEEHLERITNSVDYLTKLMDNVLMVSRAEAGKMAFNPTTIDLKELCNRMIEEMQIHKTDKHFIHLNYATDITKFELDSRQMNVILQNLLSNACKYSPVGGKIELGVNCVNSSIQITVSDQGIGIPEEDIPNLFEPFHRSKNVGEVRGTGLGLSIVKSAVELHRGKIAVTSKLNEGTIFTVDIPKL